MEPQDGTEYDGVVTVVRPLYLSEKTEWGLLLAANENGEPVKLAGAMLGRYAEEGRTLHVRARCEVWRVSPHMQPTVPPTDAYLLLGRVPHVGEKRALLLVDRYGAEAVRKIDESPRHAFSRVAHALSTGGRGGTMVAQSADAPDCAEGCCALGVTAPLRC